MELDKSYLVKKDIFSFKIGEIWKLVNQGYQAYYGEYNFIFTNDKNQKKWLILRNHSDEDMEIYHHLEMYFMETTDKETKC